MQRLVSGIHDFQTNIFCNRTELFNRLTKGQNPQALFITCSDSRMVPDMITQADPGDLFVVRNVGNLVMPYGVGSGSEAAAIEYAVRALGVKDIVVCGHTRCGAVHAMLHPDDVKELPRVKNWICQADACAEIVRSRYSDLNEMDQWKVAVEENVLVQIEHLRTHPVVAVGLANGTLNLHAWVYKMETGQVFSYEPVSGQYVEIDQKACAPVVSGRKISMDSRQVANV